MATVTFDKEESLLRGYIPLEAIEAILKKGEKVHKIDFKGNGYCTDAVLRLLTEFPKNQFSDLNEINLKGCSLLTDFSIQCLGDILRSANSLTQVDLSGCDQLTDNTYSMLAAINRVGFTCNMKGTAVKYMKCSSSVSTSNPGALTSVTGQGSEYLRGQVLVVPHSSLSHSVAEYLYSATLQESKVGVHRVDLRLGDWNMAITEVPQESYLFDNVVNTTLTQVLIPFDAAADPKDIKNHVTSTISRVVAKEPLSMKFPEVKQTPVVRSDRDWLDCHILDKLHMENGNVIRNISLSERNIGVYVSHTPFTRSHPYFEVKCIDAGSDKVALLIGCLMDLLFSHRHPMDSQDDHGGVVDGFEIKTGQVIGFGIKGEWMSEYVPSADAQFFYSVDGEERKGKVEQDTSDTPRIGMYPLISLLGESHGAIELGPLTAPPEALMKKYETEKRWADAEYVCNMVIDNEGIATYMSNYNTPKQPGMFVSRQPISIANDSFSIKILEVEDVSRIGFGIGPENIKADNKNSIMMKVGQEIVNVKPSTNAECKFTAKPGDTLTVKVEGIDTQSHGMVSSTTTLKVTFFHNKTKVYTKDDWDYKVTSEGIRLVPFVSLLPKDKELVRVQLLSYMPSYRKPAPWTNKITMGRSHFVDVLDNGTLEYKKFHNKTAYGMFMAKTPFNKNMLSFDVDFISTTTGQFFGIGIGPSNYSADSFIGWKQGSVGYHADNGQLYANSSSGSKQYFKVEESQAIISQGSKVTCRVEPLSEKTPLKFDADGNVASQQKVKIVFLKDDIVIIEYEHEHIADGMYPVVSLRDATAKVHNFYPETSEVWTMVEDESKGKNKKKKDKEKHDDEKEKNAEYQGCEFLVVSVGTGHSDPSGKLQIVQQQLGPTDTWTQLDTAIADMKQHLGELDLQDQNLLSRLCSVRDNMARLENHRNRIKFFTLDMKSEEGRSAILDQMQKCQSTHKKHQPQRYCLSDHLKEIIEKISALIKKDGMLTVHQVNVAIDYSVCGDVVDSLLELMQATGQVLLLSCGQERLVLDYSLMLATEEKLAHLSPTTMCDNRVTCIGQSSHVWDRQSLKKSILKDIQENKVDLFCRVVEQMFGLICLMCLRTKPTDTMYIYVTQENLSNPPTPLTDYWSTDSDNKDFIVMKQTYTFPVAMPPHILSLIFSNTIRYGRVVVLTSEGIVYQNGAVQTVIIKHRMADDTDEIVIESRCYMPDLKSLPETTLSNETVSYVRDYTWNVFCIYTDLVDHFLYQENIIAAVNKPRHVGLANVSVGCKHAWVFREDKVKQTVCTLCNCCCAKGTSCSYNGIMGDFLRECGCGTDLVGCEDCGICKTCASELWNMRSKLRPYAASTTEVLTTVAQKLAAKKTDPEEGDKKVEKMIMRDPVQQPFIPLDPFLYNEVEFCNFSPEPKVLCLREENDGTTVQVFPGRASYLQDADNLSSILTMSHSPDLKMRVGDHIKIRIQDPQGATYIKRNAGETVEEGKVDPQYFALFGREVKVCHETGSLFYDTASPSVPVGQFIGAKPLTKSNSSFSIKILSKGAKGTIAIGLVPKNYAPNRQPGWNSQSIGYHADDGGVFLESGWPTRKTKACAVGDIMSFHCDFDKNKGFFRKNGEQMIELNLNPSRLGFYPCVGFHSVGEAVQLMEKEVWMADNPSDPNVRPPAFTTYKYGNLWISPGYKMVYAKIGTNYNSWLQLHNPSKDPVGFKIQSGPGEKDIIFGMLEHKKEFVHSFQCIKDKVPEEMNIEWQSLESGRTYTTDDIKLLLGLTESVSQSSHNHKIRVVIQESSNVMEELPLCSKGAPVNKDVLKIEVYRNSTLVNDYWMKVGNYYLTVETNNITAQFLLKYPKCPTFQYPKSFQKGMKLTIRLENSQTYAECIVVDIYSGGKMLALEYSPEDSNANSTICVMANSSALSFTEFAEDSAKVLAYQARNTPTNLTRTFIWTPPYLLSEGGLKCLKFLDGEWKANTLRSFSQCFQVFTRLTVQEQQINNSAKRLLDWLKVESNKMYAYLPNPLNLQSLCYPRCSTMFSELAVHRLCFCVEEVMMQSSQEDESVLWRIPLHFLDMEAVVPQKKLPIEVLYSNNSTVWMYISLISNKLLLPSYSKMIEGDTGAFSREHIELMMNNLLRSYAALCGIFCARCGGLDKSEPAEDAHVIFRSLGHKMDQIIKFTGQPITETDVLVKNSGSLTCKAHLMNAGGNDGKFPSGLEFKYEYFEPYNELISTFAWSHSKLESLPKDFFEKFPNLQLFSIGKETNRMYNLKELPEGMAKLKDLRVVRIVNTAMTKLPSDIFMSPTVKELSCSGMPITELPDKTVTDGQLMCLKLTHMMVKEVPPSIGKLHELTELSLSHNPITDLPDSLSSLSKLHILKLSGVRWITFEGKRTNMTLEQYHIWHHKNPTIKYLLGEEKIEKLFHEYDINKNGSLDEEEVAGLGLHLFLNIPHLGSADFNDEVTGGVPSVVFSLKNLNQLDLDFQSITMIPQSINNLQNLNSLRLNHNPLLESLPGSLGHLPNIKDINLMSCPMLRTPPSEVVSRGFESVKAYLKRLAGGFTECRRTKLMVVGLGGAGKTSLLRALMSEKKVTSGTEKEIPTDGIDIVPWTISSKEGTQVTYSTWDFAGQAVYYNTHQFFLSKRAVYLLLWSMRQGYEHAGLDFWLSSISCHAPGTPILVIGTQCDLIPQAEVPEKDLMERYPQIVSFHQVSSITGTGIKDLEQKLLEVTLSQGYMGEKIPQVWLNFEKRILAERLTKKNYLKWDVVRSFAMEAGIYDEKDVRLAVQLLHDLGTLQYFDNDFLQDYVVINPQWIVNVMACVVSAQDSCIQKNKGRFLHCDIPTIWSEYDEDLRPWLLRLTEDFDLTFPLPKEPINVVPCLLPQEEPSDLHWPSIRNQPDIRETKMVYRFTYLPSGLFNRAQVRLFQFSDGKQVWKKGSLLSKNNHLALIKQSDDTELVVYVQGRRPENILFLIHEVFESIVEESFNGVTYDFYVPCPDCILKEGTFDPYLFNASLVQRAKDLKAPFLQCHKFFHWISMAQLQEKMPADSREVADFDLQLQQSLVALQHLNDELMIDTAIIYSPVDLQAGEDALSPVQIRNDVMSWGHQCWFAEDMENINQVDVTAAVKNCRVLIVCISDTFERDKKCCDLFLYAKETMNKEIIIVVLGESMDWQNRDLGMKIGVQERMLMAKNLTRYKAGRKAELQDWLSDKLTTQKAEKIVPDVFISYNWSNSVNAAEKSGKRVPGALGWADPRDLKSALDKAGFTCWIDTENVGKERKGIFADMAAGIRNSKIMLACISDEYASSDNCMMELRFGILNLELPLVVAVVGTKNEWKETEVAMLLRRSKAPEVYLQKENAEGFEALIKFVRSAIVDSQLLGKKKKQSVQQTKELLTQEKEKAKVKQSKTESDRNSSIAYQEEFELLQRRFMRHILGTISNMNNLPVPRLIVVDFIKAVKSKHQESDGRDSVTDAVTSSFSFGFKSKKILRPKTATRSRDRMQPVDKSILDEEENDWTVESFCVRVLCENEEGWHLCDKIYPLAFRSREMLDTFMKQAAPYLYRIYSILKQSPIKLKCFSGTKGEAFQKWIRAESEDNLDFVGALQHLREELMQDEANEFVSCLARCRLPSGKMVWLCEDHQKGEHVSKLSVSSTGGSYNTQKVLFNEDNLMRENLEKSDEYKKRKAIKSKKVVPKLPPPVPVPKYNPDINLPPPEPTEDKKVDVKDKKADDQPNPLPPAEPPKTDMKKVEEKKAEEKKLETLKEDEVDIKVKADTGETSKTSENGQKSETVDRQETGSVSSSKKGSSETGSQRISSEKKREMMKRQVIQNMVLLSDAAQKRRHSLQQTTRVPAKPTRKMSVQPQGSQRHPDKKLESMMSVSSLLTKSTAEHKKPETKTNGIMQSETKKANKMSDSGKAGEVGTSADVKLTVTRPRKITVKPQPADGQDDTSKDDAKPKRRPSIKVTGNAIQGKGNSTSEMALPQRTSSKACSIQ